MTLDEAIKHCLEVAEEQDKLCKRYDDASGYSRSHNEAIRTTDAKRCEECAAEHRQLAEWLKELKTYRKIIANAKNYRDLTIRTTFHYDEIPTIRYDITEVVVPEECKEVRQNDE